jgi:hypothetical protein
MLLHWWITLHGVYVTGACVDGPLGLSSLAIRNNSAMAMHVRQFFVAVQNA